MDSDYQNILNKYKDQEKCPNDGTKLEWHKSRGGWYADCDLCGFSIEGDYDPMDEGDPNEDVEALEAMADREVEDARDIMDEMRRGDEEI